MKTIQQVPKSKELHDQVSDYLESIGFYHCDFDNYFRLNYFRLIDRKDYEGWSDADIENEEEPLGISIAYSQDKSSIQMMVQDKGCTQHLGNYTEVEGFENCKRFIANVIDLNRYFSK